MIRIKTETMATLLQEMEWDNGQHTLDEFMDLNQMTLTTDRGYYILKCNTLELETVFRLRYSHII